jgi:hypothetical protein
MGCDDARRAVSALVDGHGHDAPPAGGAPRPGGDGAGGDAVGGDGAGAGLVEVLDVDAMRAHLALCEECTGFEELVLGIRTQLRVEPVDAAPDVVDAVLQRIRALPAPGSDDGSSPAPVVELPVAGVADTEVAGADAGVARDDADAAPVAAAAASVVRLPPPPPVPPERRGAGSSGRYVWAVTALWAGRGAISAAAAVGFLAGAAFVGLGGDGTAPAAADLPERIVTAQSAVQSLVADIEVVEHGRPDRDGAREFAGRIVYGGPETLQLTLEERPGSRERAEGSGAPGDGDVRLSVTGDRWRLDAVRGCMPAPGRAACPDGSTRVVRSVTGRAPFSESAPVPMELVAPVESFALAPAPPSLGERTIAGRRAIGVRVTAAQVARFLEQLSPAGDLRAVHPTDTVEMWLDRDDLVPLALVVRAADSPERERWAAAQGYDDRPGQEVLAFGTTGVRINEGGVGIGGASQGGPALLHAGTPELHRVDEGFTPGDAPNVPVPAALPDGYTSSRAGTTHSSAGPAVEVRSWTDGRAWVKVEATTEWTAQHLFGGLGAAVRSVDLGSGGRGYLSADGRRVAVHTDGLDVVVTGSVPTDELVELAGSLGLRGERTPEGWRESSATSIARAATRVPHLLTAAGIDGFGRPAVRLVPGDAVTQVYAGPGDRGFVLTQSPAPDLPPPADDTLGVEVRGRPGRYSAEQSLLEWSEDGTALSLTGPSLSLPELLDIAADLQAA